MPALDSHLWQPLISWTLHLIRNRLEIAQSWITLSDLITILEVSLDLHRKAAMLWPLGSSVLCPSIQARHLKIRKRGLVVRSRSKEAIRRTKVGTRRVKVTASTKTPEIERISSILRLKAIKMIVCKLNLQEPSMHSQKGQFPQEEQVQWSASKR